MSELIFFRKLQHCARRQKGRESALQQYGRARQDCSATVLSLGFITCTAAGSGGAYTE